MERQSIVSFRDLEVYNCGYRLSITVHQMSGNFPDIGKYELGKQMRRVAVSIPANIAEGFSKKESDAEFKRYLRMSLGSANEIQVYLDLAKDLGYIPDSEYIFLLEEYQILCRRISSLIRSWHSFVKTE